MSEPMYNVFSLLQQARLEGIACIELVGKANYAERVNTAKSAFTKSMNRLAAEIDALMLDYCPDEITEEQMKIYEQHQKRVDLRIAQK